jgi:hypothetical protein
MTCIEFEARYSDILEYMPINWSGIEREGTAMNKHIGRWIIGGIIGAAGLALVAATPAMAATSAAATVIWPASSYTAPSSGAIAIKAFAGGEQLETLCFVNGAYTNGSNVWLRVAIADGGGWISRSAVDVAPIPPC